jgi:predicted transcriptional regulator
MDALGDPTRRRIFELLRRRPRAVSALAAELPVSRPAVSQHLRVLERAGLVSHVRAGTQHVYAVEAAGLDEIRVWLDGFWDDTLARFAEAAEQEGTRR